MAQDITRSPVGLGSLQSGLDAFINMGKQRKLEGQQADSIAQLQSMVGQPGVTAKFELGQDGRIVPAITQQTPTPNPQATIKANQAAATLAERMLREIIENEDLANQMGLMTRVKGGLFGKTVLDPTKIEKLGDELFSRFQGQIFGAESQGDELDEIVASIFEQAQSGVRSSAQKSKPKTGATKTTTAKPTSPSDRIRVISSDGKRGTILRSKLEAAKKAGFREIKEGEDQ